MAFGDIKLNPAPASANSANNISVNWGGVHAVGDLMIAVHGTGSADSTISNAGFVVLADANNTTDADRIKIYGKIATATEDTSVTCSKVSGAPDEHSLKIFSVAGPFQVLAQAVDKLVQIGRQASGTSLNLSPSGNTTENLEFVIAALYTRSAANGGNVSWATGAFTERNDHATSYKSWSCATKVLSSIGAITCTPSFTSSSVSAGVLVSLKGVSGPTLPALSNPTVNSVDGLGGVPQVTTNLATGIVYLVMVPAGDTPTVAQIKSGQNSSGTTAGVAMNQAVSSSGVQTFPEVTTANIAFDYDCWFVFNDGLGNDSTPVNYSFSTPATAELLPQQPRVTGVYETAISTFPDNKKKLRIRIPRANHPNVPTQVIRATILESTDKVIWNELCSVGAPGGNVFDENSNLVVENDLNIESQLTGKRFYKVQLQTFDSTDTKVDIDAPTPAPPEPTTAFVFPSNAGPVSNANSVRFRFTGAALPPIYGTSGAGLTYIWKYFPVQQTGYYTTFFWANDDGAGTVNDTFLWNGGGADSYYGFHPYPNDGTPNDTNHSWEISVEQNDFFNGGVTKGQWYSQAARVRGAINAVKEHEFYWNLPNTDAPNRVTRTSPTGWGNLTPPSPALTFGDAPWQPCVERLSGRLRGVIIVNAWVSTADIITLSTAETNAQALASISSLGLTSALWYLNMNPADVNDISDKSGKGNHPAWWNANRPTLWTG